MVKTVAMVFGVLFLVLGAWGFYITGTSMVADPETAPHLLGLFPVNLLHNVVHVAFGIWGIVAARSFPAAFTYARVGGIVYLVLAVLGVVSPNGFGFVPLGGHDVWLHAVLGLALLGASFAPRTTTGTSGATTA